MKSFSFIFSALALALGAEAFFRMECQGRVNLARIDPLVSPGEPARHVHSIHGSSGISESATYDDLRNGQCTSCRVKQDMSAYWHPSMYFQDSSTGEFEVVEQVGGMLAYYQYHLDELVAFPPGFRMIAGDTNMRNWTTWDLTLTDPPADEWEARGLTTQESLRERSMGFNCLNYQGNPEPTLYRHTMPDKSFIDQNCPNGLRTEINFPSCWNGQDLDSEDHKSHMAYPDRLSSGQCPEDFPVHMPNMLYEVVWNVKKFVGRDGRFVMSNGDVSGWGYHGDFMMGWDVDFLQQVLDTCTHKSGNIVDCPLFDIVSEDQARECVMESVSILSTEDVEGPVRSLPGNVPIVFSDGHKEFGGDIPEEVAPVPSLEPNPISSTTAYVLPKPTPQEPAPEPQPEPVPAPNEVPAPEEPAPEEPTPEEPAPEEPAPEEPAPEIEQDVNIAAAAPSSQADPEPEAPEPTPAPEAPAEAEQSFFSTQMVTQGNRVSVIYWKEEVVFITEILDSTTTVTVQPTEAVAKRHLHRHAHRRRG